MKKKTVALSPEAWEKLKKLKAKTGIIIYRLVDDLLQKGLKNQKAKSEE